MRDRHLKRLIEGGMEGERDRKANYCGANIHLPRSNKTQIILDSVQCFEGYTQTKTHYIICKYIQVHVWTQHT